MINIYNTSQTNQDGEPYLEEFNLKGPILQLLTGRLGAYWCDYFHLLFNLVFLFIVFVPTNDISALPFWKTFAFINSTHYKSFKWGQQGMLTYLNLFAGAEV